MTSSSPQLKSLIKYIAMQIFWKKVSQITTVMNIVLVTGQLFFKPYFQQWNSAYFIVMAFALFAFVIAQIALFLMKKQIK